MTTAQEFFAAMHSRPDGKDGRESRQLWVVTEHLRGVRQVTGWSCAPNNPNVWWIPEIGLSTEDVFEDEADALGAWMERLVEEEARIGGLIVECATRQREPQP